MQAAKRLILVDESDREYKRLQRPADAVAKTSQSLQLSDTLRDQSIADDRKVREYVAALHKYLNVRKQVPEEVKTEPNFGVRVPPPVPQQPRPTTRRERRKPPRWAQY